MTAVLDFVGDTVSRYNNKAASAFENCNKSQKGLPLETNKIMKIGD